MKPSFVPRCAGPASDEALKVLWRLQPIVRKKDAQSTLIASLNTTKAVRHLKRVDATLAVVIARIGAPQLGREPDAWRSLSSSIIGQQVSVHAARAIRNRFAALGAGEFTTPQEVLSLSDDALRSAGLSRNKVLSLRDLAAHFEDNKIEVERFDAMDDEEIIAALIPVRGVGRWTAEMFLIFSLGRPDVLAVDDLGLRNAMRKLYDLADVPKPLQMREIGEAWRPFRSVASWYLWRSLDNEPK